MYKICISKKKKKSGITGDSVNVGCFRGHARIRLCFKKGDEAMNAAGLRRLGELCEKMSLSSHRHFICSSAEHTEPVKGNDTNVNKINF